MSKGRKGGRSGRTRKKGQEKGSPVVPEASSVQEGPEVWEASTVVSSYPALQAHGQEGAFLSEGEASNLFLDSSLAAVKGRSVDLGESLTMQGELEVERRVANPMTPQGDPGQSERAGEDDTLEDEPTDEHEVVRLVGGVSSDAAVQGRETVDAIAETEEVEFLGEIDAEDGDALLAMEVGEDFDGLTGEHFLLPHGIGAISLNVPLKRARDGLHEDDEVVVIERAGRARRLQGEIETWYRSGETDGWDSDYDASEVYEPYQYVSSDPGGNTFEDEEEFEEDDVVTELAVMGPDGRIQRHRQGSSTLQLARAADEEAEVIVRAETTLPPDARLPPAVNKGQGSGSKAVSLADQIETAFAGGTGEDDVKTRHDDRKPAPGDVETRVLEEGLLETAVASGTAGGTDEGVPEDDLGLEFLEDGTASGVIPRAAQAREVVEPVARLAAVPPAPLPRGSVPPPRVERPVVRLSHVPEVSSVPANSEAEGPVARLAPEAAKAAAVARVELRPLASTEQRRFVRPARLQERNYFIYYLSIGLTLLMAVAVYVWWQSQERSHQAALETRLAGVVAGGDHAAISKARAEVLSSEFKDASRIRDWETALTWVLFSREGLVTDEEAPDPQAVEAVSPSDPFPRVLSRVERDLLRRDVVGGSAFVEAALKTHPTLEFLEARALLDAMAVKALGASDRDPVASLNKVIEQVRQKAMGKPEEARLLTTLAFVMDLRGEDARKALANAVAASPEHIWAQVGQGVAAAMASSSYEASDEALTELLARLNEKLSPRQRSFILLQQAEVALRAAKLEHGETLLREAFRVDPTHLEALKALGQLLLDQGRNAEALKILDRAYALAPFDLPLLAARAEGLLRAAKSSDVSTELTRLPAPYLETPYARLMRARLTRSVGQVPVALSELDAAEKTGKALFDIQLERAFLSLETQRDAAKVQLTALKDQALQQGRPAARQVIIACLSRLDDGGYSSRRVLGLVSEVGDNALALRVLGEEAFAAKDTETAVALLRKAQLKGEQLDVDLLLAKLYLEDPARRSDARTLAERVVSRCSEGPLCEDARKLLETLK